MRARLLPVLLGAVVGTIVAASAAVGGEPVQVTSADLYARLSAAAAEGDSDAVAMKADLDGYLALRGITVVDLAVPERVVERLDAGPGKLLVEDLAPWVIEARSDPDIHDALSLKAYRALRHTALKALAATAPNRDLEVFLAPRSALTLPEFAARTNCVCQVHQIVVDVWGADGWIMSSGRVFDGQRLDRVAAELEDELLQQAEVSLGQFGLTRRDVVVTLRQARVSVPASAAARLTQEPDVYAVDTTADIEDALRGRAASIQVGAPPDLYAAYRDFVLGDTIQPAYEPNTKGSK